MHRVFALFLLGFAFAVCAVAQSTEAADSERLDAFIQESMDELGVPGVAVAVFENGMITQLEGYGVTGADNSAVTPQTPFQLGSVSKSFTALVITQMAAEGKLSLDDPVTKHLPDFKTKGPKTDDISVRHLMMHRSGLSMLTGNQTQATTYRGADATARSVIDLRSAKLTSAPGERFEYSNANYALLAHLAETIEKRPFEDILETRIFSPLRMENSFVQVSEKDTQPRAIGHTQWFGFTVERDFVAGRMKMGSGGVVASAEDLATYAMAVSSKDPRIVPPKLADAIYDTSIDNYGFGWFTRDLDGEALVFHGGMNPGFISRVEFYPETNRGAVIVSNMSGSQEGSLTRAAMDFALGRPVADPSPDMGAKLSL